MAKLNPAELAKLVRSAGITDPANVVIAVAIALAESGGDPGAVNHNKDKHRTTDYGLWQINGYWHPEYDTGLLLDPAYNAQAMAEISKGGTDWSQWTTFTSGRWKDHQIAAAAGSSSTGGEVGVVKDARELLNGWKDDVLGIVLAGVFTVAALALVAIGLSKLTGLAPGPILGGASTAATAATLAA